jgi:fido (protein-threonine AMPylation protein)
MEFFDQPTEAALKAWRFGGTQSERLCATLLHSEGFKRVDPQCPLGGPDGIKDVLFELNGWRYVAACYFPTMEKHFKDVQKKFKDDFKGVVRNKARGIAFFTNQHLTPGERESMEQVAKDASASVRIYHVEAIRAILDSPRGYGMRLEYLRIPMKPEEQASFISQFGSDLSAAMDRHSDVLSSISKNVAEIHAAVVSKTEDSFVHLPARLAATMATRAMVAELVEASDKSDIKAKTSFITQQLDKDLLCYLHRSMFDDELQAEQSGILRSVGVWIGTPGSTPEHARYIPPKPKELPDLVNTLLQSWREGYESALASGKPEKLKRIVSFHYEFLRIHPFLDGNGRLARLILEQQARELLNIERRIVLEDSVAYFEALQKAHSGELEPLQLIITQALLGSWDSAG